MTTTHDQRNYEKETLNTFERIGAYFVGIFWKYLHESAVTEHTKGEHKSLTDAYKKACMLYRSSLDDSTQFSKTISDLYNHFQVQLSGLSYTGFIDTISKELIPKEYWSNANSEQKNRIIGLCIQRAVNNFVIWFITPLMMNLAVDRRDPKAIVETLQNYMLDMFLDQRVKSFEEFAKSQTRAGLDNSKSSMANVAVLTAKNKLLTTQLAHACKLLKQSQDEKAYLMKRLQGELKKPTSVILTPVEVAPPSLPRRKPAPKAEAESYVRDEPSVDQIAQLARRRKAERANKSSEKELSDLLQGLDLEETMFE